MKFDPNEWKILAKAGFVEKGDDGKNHASVEVLTKEQREALDQVVLEHEFEAVIQQRIATLEVEKAKRLGIPVSQVSLTKEEKRQIWDFDTQAKYLLQQRSRGRLVYSRDTDSK